MSRRTATVLPILAFAIIVCFVGGGLHVGRVAAEEPQKPASDTSALSTEEAELQKLKARLADMDLPTVKAMAEGCAMANKAFDEGRYADAVSLFLATARVANMLANIANVNSDHCEHEGKRWGMSAVYANKIQQALKSEGKFLQTRDDCWLNAALCYRKLGDDKAALAYLINVAESGGRAFPAAWEEIASITGI